MSRYTWLKTFETFNRICSEWDKEYQGIDDLKWICTEWIESRLQNTPIKFIGENNPYYKGNNKTYRPDLRYKIVWPSFYIWGREDLIRPHLGAVKKYIKTLCYAKKDINKVDCDKTKILKRKSRFSGGAYDYESQSESNIIKK